MNVESALLWATDLDWIASADESEDPAMVLSVKVSVLQTRVLLSDDSSSGSYTKYSFADSCSIEGGLNE